MLSRLRHGVNSARQILKTEGLVSLLRRMGRFIQLKCFVCITSNLYETTAENFAILNEADFMPKTDNFTLKIVSSNEEADKLKAEGFEFRSQNANSLYYLDNGAVAICIFVENELAHLGWVEMTRQLTDTDIMKVDCSNTEAHGGWSWTNPKYRRLGFGRYGHFKRRQFVFDNGKSVHRGSTSKSNIANRALQPNTTKKYAEVRYLKILGWRDIKTTYVDGYKTPNSPLA